MDEVNSLVGTVRPTRYEDVDERLRTIQNQLHVLHADVTNPDPSGDHPAVTGQHVSVLEQWIDSYAGVYGVMCRNTVPGGTAAGARLHQARAVCQRAERRAVRLRERDGINELIVRYLNRLADVLFVFARVVNERSGRPERIHAPGGE